MTRASHLHRLRRQLNGRRQSDLPAVPSLSAPPAEMWSGLPLEVAEGSLIELLSQGPGTGASTWAFRFASECQLSQRPVIVIDPSCEFFPPGADKMGVCLSRTAVVRPSRCEDVLWVLEQSLRSQAGGVVICRIERITPAVYRRLKLAAERGRSRGLLLRPACYQSAASWADLRLLIEPHPLPRSSLPFQSRRLRLEVLYLKGRGFERQVSRIDICDATGAVSMVAELADPTAVADSA